MTRKTPLPTPPPIQDSSKLQTPKNPWLQRALEKEKTLDLTFHSSGTASSALHTVQQAITSTKENQPYAGGLVVEKAKFVRRDFLKDGSGNLLAVVIMEGTNYNPRMLICCPKPMTHGQEPCKYKEDNHPLYCWYKVHGHYPVSDLYVEVWQQANNSYTTLYTSQQHYSGKTCCFGFAKSLGGLSLFMATNNKPVALFSSTPKRWNMHISPGMDPGLMILFAVCIDISSGYGH